MKTYGFARLTGSLAVKNFFSIKFASVEFVFFSQHIFILIDTSDSAVQLVPLSALNENKPCAKWVI